MTKPHSDVCRARMDGLMQRDKDALVRRRLHADRLRRGSMIGGANGDERRDPDVEMIGSGLPAGSSGDAPQVEGAEVSTRTVTGAAGSSGDCTPSRRGQKNP